MIPRRICLPQTAQRLKAQGVMDDDLRFRGKDSENPIILPDDSDEIPRGHVKKGPCLKRTRKRNMQIERVGRTLRIFYQHEQTA
jgi:hypothetical protein